MSRACDGCKEKIKLGSNHIEVRFIGMKKVEKMFGSSQLDFCTLECLILFWSDKGRVKT